MTDHATLSRRQMIGSTLSLLGLGGWALAGAGGRRSPAAALDTLPPPAAEPGVAVAARAVEPAVRLGSSGRLAFPVELGSSADSGADAGLIVLNNFGARSVANGSCAHRGIDVFTKDSAAGRPLVACVDGVVYAVRELDGSQGNAVILLDVAGDAYRYHHLDEFEPGIEDGVSIRRGERIGTMGSTGNANWPHLHFEVRRGGHSGTAVDPVPLLPFPIAGVDLTAPTGCSS